jgi:uncharacterized iron-regulated membrane protein
MRLLATLHRWAGGLIGLALALIGLSGTLLVWEDTWIGLPYADAPAQVSPAALARTMEAATASGGLSRITFAGPEIGLHQAIYNDGSGAYFGPQAQEVARWSSEWGRPELWLFDFHHHLFTGETGETITGVLGLVGLLFVISGTILWWRTRKTFQLRAWPARMTRPAIIRHHRDLGIVAAPLLLVSMATGVLMLFEPLAQAAFAPWGSLKSAEAPELPQAGAVGPETDWHAIFAAAQARFPAAEPRRLQLPNKPGEPVTLRMRQPFEWTPNGRTYLRFDPVAARLLSVEDPALGNGAKAAQEKLYPIHSAKVGGWAWKLAITCSGLALTLLGSLSVWSFWFRRNKTRPAAALPAVPAAV